MIRLEPRRSQSVVNLGNVYVGGSNLNKNKPATIYAVLSPEQVDGLPIMSPGSSFDIDVSNWWIDADNAGDAVLVGIMY